MNCLAITTTKIIIKWSFVNVSVFFQLTSQNLRFLASPLAKTSERYEQHQHNFCKCIKTVRRYRSLAYDYQGPQRAKAKYWIKSTTTEAGMRMKKT